MRQVRFYYDMDVDEDDIREKYDLSDDDEITDEMLLEFANEKFDEEVDDGEVHSLLCESEIID